MVLTKDLIEHSLFPLKSSDTVDFAKEMLLAYQTSGLPVVDDDKILGFVEAHVLEEADLAETLVKHMTPHPGWILGVNTHFFEAVKRFGEFKAPCLAAIDGNSDFTGIITYGKVFTYLADSYTYHAEGSVICIEMSSKNYSLTELSQIIESNDAKIIGVSVFSIQKGDQILVNIKLNTNFTERIISSLQRFGFEVTASFYNKQNESDFENRYQSLLKYLEF